MAGTHKNEDEVKGAARRWLPPQPQRMQLMERDQRMLQWVFDATLATREQLQRLFFPSNNRAACQRRLTLLRRNRFLDKLPNQPANAPDIYFISGRATRGLQVLRALRPEEAIRPRSVTSAKVEHTLEIANCRIALLRACSTLGYSLSAWLREEELAGRMQPRSPLPDAYFQIARTTGEGERRSSFFLEVERSAKSEQALEQKFKRYGDFYYQGHYEAQFQAKALRVLVLFGTDYGLNPQRQVEKCAAICRRLEITFMRFARLGEFLQHAPERLLSEPFWRQPKDDDLISLF